MSNILDLAHQPMDAGFLVEASAGTGKTYSVVGLVTRLLATDEATRIGNILITTFTRNAAAELRERIRRGVIDAVAALEGEPREKDIDNEVLSFLRQGSPSEVDDRITRLRRAAIEFDTATIATIHSVLSKILSLAGRPITPGDDDSESKRIIDEVVNDHLVNEAIQGRAWDEDRIRDLVVAQLGEPLTALWFDPSSTADSEVLRQARSLVARCVQEVNQRSVDHPSFNDLLRLAHEIVMDPANDAMVREFQSRYSLAIIDESQDTDAVQWELFNKLFPVAGNGALVAVGDPKQSIYKFRGADIDAYSRQKSLMPVVTLTTNYRTDQPLIEAFNTLLDGFSFGPSVAYEEVQASPNHSKSRISGVPPFETVDFGNANIGRALARATARRVLHLLNIAQIDGRPIRPSEVVVLVRSGGNGLLIERELHRWSVPAVSSGTASVMESEMARDIRLLLESMDRVADVGRARRLAATKFIDSSLSDPRLGDDDFVSDIQDQVAGWLVTLRNDGVAGLMSTMLNDALLVARITAGRGGQRHLTDFSHVLELLHGRSIECGSAPEALLQVFDELVDADATSELVARRVESDTNAVQIMTVHLSKGLEFPVVVVADTWTKPGTRGKAKPKIARVDEDGQSKRIIDLTHAVPGVSSATVDAAHLDAEFEEGRRLFYVAVTRAKHHVSLMLAPHDGKFKPAVLTSQGADAVRTALHSLPVIGVESLPVPTHYNDAQNAGVTATLEVAGVESHVEQSYRRTSFTGITQIRQGNSASVHGAPGSGADEFAQLATFPQYAPIDVPLGAHMPLARVPGGVHLGKVMHKVYELVDVAAVDLAAEVQHVVSRVVAGPTLAPHRDAIAEAVLLSMLTPLGPIMDNRTLASIGATDRLAELDFEMGLASLTRGVVARDIGRVLVDLLPADDALTSYAALLAGPSFNIPLAGLINGSIDVLLRLDSTDGPRLFITDYKTNRLDSESDQKIIDAYSPSRLVHAMEHHHYPLQALIYGTAVHRWLRWRAPQVDADAAVAGVSYFFVRAMVGPETPVDNTGQPYGVFSWTPPAGLWSALSVALAGGSR